MTDSAGTSRIAGCGAGSLSSTRCLAAISAGTSRTAGCGVGSPSSTRCLAAISAGTSRVAGCGAGSPSSARCRAAISATASSIDTLSAFVAGRLRTGAGADGRSIGRRGCCRRSGQPPIGIVMSFAERSGATLRRQLARGRLAARQPFQLLGKLVETGVDLVQRAARAGALALEFADFFRAALLVAIAARARRGRGAAPAAPDRRRVASAHDRRRGAAFHAHRRVAALPDRCCVAAAPDHRRVAAAPARRAGTASGAAARRRPRRHNRRTVSARRLLFVVRLDDVIEPFADRHAGSPRRRAHGFPRLGAQASEIPRTARFHSHDQSHMGGAGCPLRADLAEGRCSRRGPVSPAVDFSGIG